MLHTFYNILLVASFVGSIGVARLVGGPWIWLLTAPSLLTVGYLTYKLLRAGSKAKPLPVDADGNPIPPPLRWPVAFWIHHPKRGMLILIIVLLALMALAGLAPGGTGVGRYPGVANAYA
jgi:hypothetical protein